MSYVMRNNSSKFEIPSEGVHQAVLVDVIALGEVETGYGPKQKLRFRWLVDELGTFGKPLGVIASYNNTWHEKSSLRRDIKAMLGRDPGEQFDLASLIGQNCRLVIKHAEHEGKTYANIGAVLRLEAGITTMSIPEHFRRDTRSVVFSRNGGAGHGTEAGAEHSPINDSDIPF
jgi:hypothetical protein